MHHFIYKTQHQGGKYYIGRHSTNNISDGYIGSGKWIRSIKNKLDLHREIIKFVNSFEELLEEERKFLEKVIDDPLNMNFNNNSCGFAFGNSNPAHSEQEKIRRSKENWMKTDEGRRWLSQNNPSKKTEVKRKRREYAQKQLSNGTHNFLKPKTREKIIESAKKQLRTNNPMWNIECREKVSEALKGKALPRLKCPKCGKIGGGHANMYRWHFDNCKNFSQKL